MLAATLRFVPRQKKAKPEGAPYGSVDVRLTLRLSAELAAAARTAAKAEGLGAAEWWRRAGLRTLKRKR